MVDEIDARALARRRERGEPEHPNEGKRPGAGAASEEERIAVQRDRKAKRLEYGRKWRAANKDKARRSALEWRERNPERAREQNRQSAHRSSLRKAKREAALAKQRAHYAANRDHILAQKRRWNEAHPEKDREYRQRWKQRHPERAAESDRRSSQKYWDNNADRQRARSRARHQERYAQDPDYYRRSYQKNIEQRRAYARETNRLRSRLNKLGLPPRIRHHVPAEQKRANDAAADAFFARRRNQQQKDALMLERAAAPHTRLARLEARRDAGLTPPTREEIAHVESINKRALERDVWSGAIPNLVRAFVRQHRDRISEEIRLDSVARQYSGKPAYDPRAELLRRMRIEGFAHVARILVPDGNPEAVRHLHEVMFPRRTPTAAGPTAVPCTSAPSSTSAIDVNR